MVYVPRYREQYAAQNGLLPEILLEFAEETPLVTAISLVGSQMLAWPLYLFFNASGHTNYKMVEGQRGKANTTDQEAVFIT